MPFIVTPQRFVFSLSVFSRYLLTEQSRLRSVNDIMPMIGARFYTQLDASQMRNDVIEEDLAKVKESRHMSWSGEKVPAWHCGLNEGRRFGEAG